MSKGTARGIVPLITALLFASLITLMVILGSGERGGAVPDRHTRLTVSDIPWPQPARSTPTP